ncbi:MAG: type B 50S ribosomal protein L31 [Mycobacterium sp.]
MVPFRKRSDSRRRFVQRGEHPVVFQDASTGARFLTPSTITSSKTVEWETPTGVQNYPPVVVEVSSDSHPFWTGTRRTLDTAGRVEKFYRRYGQRVSRE